MARLCLLIPTQDQLQVSGLSCSSDPKGILSARDRVIDADASWVGGSHFKIAIDAL
jgi:hypothetical protein